MDLLGSYGSLLDGPRSLFPWGSQGPLRAPWGLMEASWSFLGLPGALQMGLPQPGHNSYWGA